jgi:hypothetical protein
MNGMETIRSDSKHSSDDMAGLAVLYPMLFGSASGLVLGGIIGDRLVYQFGPPTKEQDEDL